MNKRVLFGLLAAQVIASTSLMAYNVSFDLQADLLKTSTSIAMPTIGTAMPTSSVYLLVASTTNATFGLLSPGASLALGSFISGDDQIIGKGNLMTPDNTPGSLAVSLAINTTNFSTDLGGGDNLILYWFPTLTLSSATLSGGDSYGAFRTDTTLDSTQAWVLPAATTNNYRLYFSTMDAAIYGPGTSLSAAGNASFAVVPEPSTYLLGLLGSVGLTMVAFRRRSTLTS